jgi:hypothetical protein
MKLPMTSTDKVDPWLVLTKLNGVPDKVHVCPTAGAALHCVDPNTPGPAENASKCNAGSASKVIAFSMPLGGGDRLTSLMNADVPIRLANVPLLPSTTVARPLPLKRGVKSIEAELNSTAPVKFKLPVTTAAEDGPLVASIPAQIAADRKARYIQVSSLIFA